MVQPSEAATAIVTGAAGGMGRAIVAELVGRGYRVAGFDIDLPGLDHVKEQVESRGGNFQPIGCDLTDPQAIASAFEQVDREMGEIAALVNNAGTCFMGEFPDITGDELDRQMTINFNGAFHCCQQAVRRMRSQPGVKKIVNISSNGAYNFDVFDPPHYRASKAALDTLTKDLARRYAREQISVNSIAPAMTETPLFGVLSKSVLDKAIAAMPHGRAMRPEEVAAWVGFLISPAGDIASGNVIILNQGRDVR
ncbi:SDR family oxidoreductase (plasmid) [Mesorhizobium sp. INR15]|nr:SDR family oxidoreductase [Mesorhizobium sp. INR15]